MTHPNNDRPERLERPERPVLHDPDAVVGDCGVYEDGRRRPGRILLKEAGEAARDTEGFVWIGLQQPTTADIERVRGRAGIEYASTPPVLMPQRSSRAHPWNTISCRSGRRPDRLTLFTR